MNAIHRRRHEARDLGSFLNWARSAYRGDYCIYHRGNLGFDRAQSTSTRRLAATVRLLAEFDYLILAQNPMITPDNELQREYIATRTGYGFPPRSVMDQAVTVTQFQALRGLMDYTSNNFERKSARRAVRDAIHASNDDVADAMFADLLQRGFIESKGPDCGYDLTALGLRMLV